MRAVKLTMKYLLLLLTITCACQAVNPSDEALAHQAKHPAIRFSEFEYHEEADLLYAVFNLVNPTTDEYTYQQQIGPLYYSFDLGNPNWFERFRICGDGISIHPLLPGDAIPLIVTIDTKVGPVQVRMSIWDRFGTEIKLISDEVDITEAKTKRPPVWRNS